MTQTFLILWAVAILLGLGIGNRKGHPAIGFALGAILGVIGLIILLFVPTSDQRKIDRARERQRIENAARRHDGSRAGE